MPAQRSFPLWESLIEIAIYERNPQRVLYWYERLPENRLGWFGLDEDRIATAVETHAPDRAVAIWQHKAERLIAQTKPRSYEEAGRFLRKAARVMARAGKQRQWVQYLHSLRQTHARKRRFMQVLDGLSDKAIIAKGRRSRPSAAG